LRYTAAARRWQGLSTLKQPGDAAALRHLDGIPVPELRLSAGAEFVAAICGDIMAVPGLPKVPAAIAPAATVGKVIYGGGRASDRELATLPSAAMIARSPAGADLARMVPVPVLTRVGGDRAARRRDPDRPCQALRPPIKRRRCRNRA
jgi:Formate--tetrahydrofolate ligase